MTSAPEISGRGRKDQKATTPGEWDAVDAVGQWSVRSSVALLGEDPRANWARLELVAPKSSRDQHWRRGRSAANRGCSEGIGASHETR